MILPRFTTFISLTLLAAVSGAHDARAASKAKEGFMQLQHCLQTEPANVCRDYLTAASATYYDKLTDYDLLRCIPTNGKVLSETPAGSYRMIKIEAHTEDGSRARTKLAYVQEDGAWKLDVPQTLRAGLGEKWKQTVDLTEQLFLAVRARGHQYVTCETIAMLVPRKQGD